MSSGNERDFVEALIRRNRYLVLSSTNGKDPWAAPLEYMADDKLNLYFFSTVDSRHACDIEMNEKVAVAIFDSDQPEYSADLSASLNGVQIEATARKVPENEYIEEIIAAIEALKPPMPPYAVYQLRPRTFYLPKITKGVNVRTEVK